MKGFVMRRAVFLMIAGLALLSAPVTVFPQSADQPGKIGLRVLYAGHHGSPREKDFVDFLSKYFADVKTMELRTFNEKSTAGVDVVIFDYDRDEPGNFIDQLLPRLSEDYKRATVTVGVPGALICSRLHLKTGYT
jgi:hypothetical protein